MGVWFGAQPFAVTTLIVGIGEVLGGGIRGRGPMPAVTGYRAAPPQAEARIGASGSKHLMNFWFWLMPTSRRVRLPGARGKNQATSEKPFAAEGEKQTRVGERFDLRRVRNETMAFCV